MTRTPTLHAPVALALLALSGAAGAAEVTRVASSADPDNPFDLDLTLGYRHVLQRAKITREALATTGRVDNVAELRYTRTGDFPTARIAVGLYHDLELHVEVPWVLGDDHAWKYASGVSDASSTIFNEPIDASGVACPGGPGTCPIFPVGRTAYHGKVLGDFLAGVAWGILSERRDDTKPNWVVGLDVTFPSAGLYDPSTAPQSYDKGNPASVGQKIWRYDMWTALSRQFGPVDPYVKLHVSLPARSGTTYSNCDRAAQLAAQTPPQPQMDASAVANCAVWGDSAGAKPPRVIGVVFGSELVAYENRTESQRVAFDLRVGADWTSASRWYNELTDATGKLLHTDPHATLEARLGLYLRASSYIQLRLAAGFGWQSDHYISGEPLARANGTEPNPNYDWRYDTIGRRFRVSESTVLDLSAAAVIGF